MQKTKPKKKWIVLFKLHSICFKDKNNDVRHWITGKKWKSDLQESCLVCVYVNVSVRKTKPIWPFLRGKLEPNLLFNFHKVSCNWPKRQEDPQNIFQRATKECPGVQASRSGWPQFCGWPQRVFRLCLWRRPTSTRTICQRLQNFASDLVAAGVIWCWLNALHWRTCMRDLVHLCTSRWRLIRDVSSPWTRVTVWWIYIMNEYLCFASQQNSFVASVTSVPLLSGLSALLPQALPAPSGASFPWLTWKRLHVPAAKSPVNKSLQNIMQRSTDLIIFFQQLATAKFAAPFHSQNCKSSYTQ